VYSGSSARSSASAVHAQAVARRYGFVVINFVECLVKYKTFKVAIEMAACAQLPVIAELPETENDFVESPPRLRVSIPRSDVQMWDRERSPVCACWFW